MSIDQIAAERNLVKSTVISHLTSYVMEGKIDVHLLVSSAHEKKIRAFIQAHPEVEQISEIKDALGDDFEYWEIRLIYRSAQPL